MWKSEAFQHVWFESISYRINSKHTDSGQVQALPTCFCLPLLPLTTYKLPVRLALSVSCLCWSNQSTSKKTGSIMKGTDMLVIKSSDSEKLWLYSKIHHLHHATANFSPMASLCFLLNLKLPNTSDDYIWFQITSVIWNVTWLFLTFLFTNLVLDLRN